MTKPVISVAMMTLYERGLFQLNTPVSRFFPEWRDQRVWVSGEGDEMVTEEARRPVSIQDLLCHTAGLTYGDQLPARVYPSGYGFAVEKVYAELGVPCARDETLSGMMDKLAHVPLAFHPGEKWAYSVATLIEKISGQRLDEFLKGVVLEPLGMKDTAFHVPQEKIDRFCANYQINADKRLELVDAPRTSEFLTPPQFFSCGGDPGLVSTTRDYLRFCETLRRGGELDGIRILGPRTVELMRRNHLKDGAYLPQMAAIDFSALAWHGVGFGLGFGVTIDSVRRGRFGEGAFFWGGSAGTYFWVDPVEDFSVICMAQLNGSEYGSFFDFEGPLTNMVYAAIED